MLKKWQSANLRAKKVKIYKLIRLNLCDLTALMVPSNESYPIWIPNLIANNSQLNALINKNDREEKINNTSKDQMKSL